MAEVFNIGLRIGKYELTRKLAEGGFGVLYVARDTELERELVIKFLLPEHAGNEQVVQRFLAEGRAIAKIAHPGIVTVYETGEVGNTRTAADGSAYIIMEYLVGETLAQRLKRSGRLSVAVAMEVTRQVANALQAAHDIGIVHRDLKPDNIMLIKDGSLSLGERAKVLDFGIAKQASTTDASRAHKTQQGLVFGTPIYMSPEQAKSTANATNQSDIYSLGCILFELLVGTPPFEGSMVEIITHHILTPAPIPSTKAPGIPPHLDQVLTAMMAKEPDERPASMKVVEAILEEKRVVASMARKQTLGGAKLITQLPPLDGAQQSPAQVLANLRNFTPQPPGMSAGPPTPIHTGHAADSPMHVAHQRYETGPQPPLVATPPGQWPTQPTPVPGFAPPHHTPPPQQAPVQHEVIMPTTPTTLNAATGVATNIPSSTKKGKGGLIIGIGLIAAIGIAVTVIAMQSGGVEAPSLTPTETKPAAQPMTVPAEATPTTTTKPATTTPATTTPTTTTKPVETKPVITTKPVETKPVTTKPAVIKPATTKPATTTKPAQTKPITKPTTKPAQTKPTTTKTKPGGTFDGDF